jgi:uncharacterized membrane protein YphA (DoxX/SURF4 family)
VDFKLKQNNMWKVYGIMLLVVIIIAVFWVRGIDNMMKNHPDYKGEDLFGDGFNFDDKKEEKKDE